MMGWWPFILISVLFTIYYLIYLFSFTCNSFCHYCFLIHLEVIFVLFGLDISDVDYMNQTLHYSYAVCEPPFLVLVLSFFFLTTYGLFIIQYMNISIVWLYNVYIVTYWICVAKYLCLMVYIVIQ